VTILLAVEVPFVTKKLCRLPNASATFSWATLRGPVGCRSESSPPVVGEVSARKMLGP
jgi:hypothetical protein